MPVHLNGKRRQQETWAQQSVSPWLPAGSSCESREPWAPSRGAAVEASGGCASGGSRGMAAEGPAAAGYETAQGETGNQHCSIPSTAGDG